MDQIAHAPEELHDHIPDLSPISDEHRHQRAQMQQHVEKRRDIRRVEGAQQTLRDGQMAGAGDGQKFGQSLDQP